MHAFILWASFGLRCRTVRFFSSSCSPLKARNSPVMKAAVIHLSSLTKSMRGKHANMWTNEKKALIKSQRLSSPHCGHVPPWAAVIRPEPRCSPNTPHLTALLLSETHRRAALDPESLIIIIQAPSVLGVGRCWVFTLQQPRGDHC